ncbi:hypothetical protein RUND412_002754 [Rhizina undulata]
MSPERDSPSVGGDQGAFTIHQDPIDNSAAMDSLHKHSFTNEACADGNAAEDLVPLITSKMGNVAPVVVLTPADEHLIHQGVSLEKVDKAAHQENQEKSGQVTSKNEVSKPSTETAELAAKSNKQHMLIEEQLAALSCKEAEHARVRNVVPDTHSGFSSYNTPVAVGTESTPISFNYVTSPPAGTSETRGQETIGFQNLDDINRLQNELKAAQSKIIEMNQELAQTRITRQTLDQALGHSGNNSLHNGEEPEEAIASLHNAFSQPSRPLMARHDTWPTGFEDPNNAPPTEYPESPISAGPYGRNPGIWATNSRPSITQMPALPLPSPAEVQYAVSMRRANSMDQSDVYGAGVRGWNNNSNNRQYPSLTSPVPSVTGEGRGYMSRRPSYNSSASFMRSSFDGSSGMERSAISTAYNPAPIGTPLSPTASTTNEFAPGHPVWGGQPQCPQQAGQTYAATIEPLNYRRLLERSVNCNWKYIVDKIICNNDQQASIFLQQKLKIGNAEQKHAIVDAIVAQAYPLMINRFGNFLVQRCFEHGTQEQINGIANAIRGNTLTLSMDAFGCHVIQKAFDCVAEDFKATMVSELLRRIPETVVHRYACHVWQKLFELRWLDSPPQIMKYVNEALHGMWPEVALGETGSLVVQNIFENCLEEDKRPCINEVLDNIDIIAHGQFGNWCIQHICEHGAPLDRSRAIDIVIQNASTYSMDQYASKVVEKCLKIGGCEFLDRYLDRVCEGRQDRPRIPLIDIASDQYGNYLVQWVLQHASPAHREQVAVHIRKHMVSLRGSKFGSRVGMLCCNPIYSRPNHGAASGSGQRFNRFGYR